MGKNNPTHVGRRRYLSGVAAAGASVGLLGKGTGRARAGSDESHDVGGASVYLVFGADLSETSLDSWTETRLHESDDIVEESTTEVIQFQDVTQIAIHQESASVAISINGGDATAVQSTSQENDNTQEGSAQSVAVERETAHQTFENAENVYIVFAEEIESREFSGWVVSDETYESTQSAEATVEQVQQVDQLNFNSQSTALAVAENGSHSQAHQESFQENINFQLAEAAAANIGSRASQEASASAEQVQGVEQINLDEEGVAIAIAIGSESVAEATQITHQLNANAQVAEVAAINFDSQILEDATASAEMVAQLSESEVSLGDGGGAQSNAQIASTDILQVQSVGQENISLENAAIAVADEKSHAIARQGTYQANFNAQIASGISVNLDEGCQRICAVVNGTDSDADGSWALDYADGEEETEQQVTSTEILQAQLVDQLNVIDEFAAIATATNCGEAVAEQITAQTNENIQVTD